MKLFSFLTAIVVILSTSAYGAVPVVAPPPLRLVAGPAKMSNDSLPPLLPPSTKAIALNPADNFPANARVAARIRAGGRPNSNYKVLHFTKRLIPNEAFLFKPHGKPSSLFYYEYSNEGRIRDKKLLKEVFLPHLYFSCTPHATTLEIIDRADKHAAGQQFAYPLIHGIHADRSFFSPARTLFALVSNEGLRLINTQTGAVSNPLRTDDHTRWSFVDERTLQSTQRIQQLQQGQRRGLPLIATQHYTIQQ